MIRTYFELKEFIGIAFPETPDLREKAYDALYLSKTYKTSNKTLLMLIAEQLFNEDVLVSSQVIFDDTCNELFCKYIVPRYMNEAIGYLNGSFDEADVIALFKEFFRVIANRIITSYDEYKKLIDLYTNVKNNLLDDIKSTTKYNDTPQTKVTGEYDDNYNTNVTTNLTEGASKIARLKEIEDLITDYYDKWANYVCKGIFIYE